MQDNEFEFRKYLVQILIVSKTKLLVTIRHSGFGCYFEAKSEWPNHKHRSPYFAVEMVVTKAQVTKLDRHTKVFELSVCVFASVAHFHLRNNSCVVGFLALMWPEKKIDGPISALSRRPSHECDPSRLCFRFRVPPPLYVVYKYGTALSLKRPTPIASADKASTPWGK